MRELLLHALARYHLACPAYCLMPDHGHFLWVGLGDSGDQQKATAFFRRHWNALLRPLGFELQLQGFDHVLRSEEREHGAFSTVAAYILETPARASLVEDWRRYSFSGAVIVGRPDLDPRAEDF